jgi:hypothetical protein
MLTLKPGFEDHLIEVSFEEIVVRQPFARKNSPSVIDER